MELVEFRKEKQDIFDMELSSQKFWPSKDGRF